MPGFKFSQQQKQTQVQVLSQKQIQSLKFLELKTSDLNETIYKEAEENPVLIVEDTRQKFTGPRDYTRIKSGIGKTAQEASENFQAALEAAGDTRTSLYEHLLQQFNVIPGLTEQELELGRNLIYNLDGHGFYILDPATFLHGHSGQTLKKIITLIQQLDPVGTCTANVEESLLVQAKQKPESTPLEIFILSGHLNLIDPPRPDKAAKKITAFLQEQEKLFGSKKTAVNSSDITEKNVQKAIELIRQLDPNPTRNFSVQEAHYVTPDIYVEKLVDHYSADDFAKGIVTGEKSSFLVKAADGIIPSIKIDPYFSKEMQNQAMAENIRRAKEFISTIEYRQNTILLSCCHIVKSQIDFFENGKGHLAPLTQKDIAKKVGVHEATISRMANSKYIQCEWGLFDIKYFFVNAVKSYSKAQSSSEPGTEPAAASRDAVLHAMQKILNAQADSSKPLSDQKLSDALAEKGFKVARRTVAKYRTLLNINSSYGR